MPKYRVDVTVRVTQVVPIIVDASSTQVAAFAAQQRALETLGGAIDFESASSLNAFPVIGQEEPSGDAEVFATSAPVRYKTQTEHRINGVNIVAGTEVEFLRFSGSNVEVLDVSGSNKYIYDQATFFNYYSAIGASQILTAEECAEVAGGNSFAITTSSLPEGMQGSDYTQNILVNALGNPPFSFALLDGQLPDGLTLDKSFGVISGIPTASGTFIFTIQVTDVQTTLARRELSILIPAGPTIITDETQIGTALTPYIHGPLGRVQSDGTAPITYEITPVPSGVNIDAIADGATIKASDGTISWTPSVAGTYEFRVTATNDAGSDEQDVTVTVS